MYTEPNCMNSNVIYSRYSDISEPMDNVPCLIMHVTCTLLKHLNLSLEVVLLNMKRKKWRSGWQAYTERFSDTES